MVTPEDVPRILNDAARLVRDGEIVVFGSASLALWLDAAPSSRDVDLWVMPEERGEIVEALMGELSWYHDKHGAYVEVCGPETFEAPSSWRARAKTLTPPDSQNVRIVVPHPHDVLIAKLPRYAPSDREHARLIVEQMPLDHETFTKLADEAPSRAAGADAAARRAFDIHAAILEKALS